jgi:hypothetical protein
MYLRIFGSFTPAKNDWVRKSQIRKSQKYMVSKSQIATFSENPHFFKNIYSANLRICGPPTFDGNTPLSPVSCDFDSLQGQAMPIQKLLYLKKPVKGLAASGL